MRDQINKLLRAITPVVLVLFVSTSIIGPAWGKENDNKQEKIVDVEIEMTLYSYDLKENRIIAAIDRPMAGEVIKLDLKVQGKGNQITEVSMLSNAFTYIDSFKEQDSSPWIHREAFILKAPEAAGSYICTFKCTDKDGDSVLIDRTINVVQAGKPQDPGTVVPNPGKVTPNPPSYTDRNIQPVYPGMGMGMHMAQQPPQTGTVSTESRYYSHSTHIQMGCGWSMFWLGFIVGVLITSAIYASSSERAAK